MIINWASNQQYFGAYILTWDSAFAEYTPEPGKILGRFIFLAGRKRQMFDSETKVQKFISKDERIR